MYRLLSVFLLIILFFCFFFFNDTATTEIYTLSLHDALPICRGFWRSDAGRHRRPVCHAVDRKSTRLNSSHTVISYAVFCLKKKKTKKTTALMTKKKQKKTIEITQKVDN